MSDSSSNNNSSKSKHNEDGNVSVEIEGLGVSGDTRTDENNGPTWLDVATRETMSVGDDDDDHDQWMEKAEKAIEEATKLFAAATGTIYVGDENVESRLSGSIDPSGVAAFSTDGAAILGGVAGVARAWADLEDVYDDYEDDDDFAFSEEAASDDDKVAPCKVDEVDDAILLAVAAATIGRGDLKDGDDDQVTILDDAATAAKGAPFEVVEESTLLAGATSAIIDTEPDKAILDDTTGDAFLSEAVAATVFAEVAGEERETAVSDDTAARTADASKTTHFDPNFATPSIERDEKASTKLLWEMYKLMGCDDALLTDREEIMAVIHTETQYLCSETMTEEARERGEKVLVEKLQKMVSSANTEFLNRQADRARSF